MLWGANFLLSAFTANFAKKGANARAAPSDNWWHTVPAGEGEAYVRAGDRERYTQHPVVLEQSAERLFDLLGYTTWFYFGQTDALSSASACVRGSSAFPSCASRRRIG